MIEFSTDVVSRYFRIPLSLFQKREWVSAAISHRESLLEVMPDEDLRDREAIIFANNVMKDVVRGEQKETPTPVTGLKFHVVKNQQKGGTAA